MNELNFIETAIELFSDPTFLWVSFFISLAFVFVSAVLFPVVIVLLPRNYFLYENHSHPWLQKRSSSVQAIIIVLKNILGGLLLIAGVAMLFLPGQGLLTCLVALSFLDFPGKLHLIRSIVRRKTVFRAMNGLRLYFKKKPFRIPKKKPDSA